jgi:hypothetical protein
MTTSIELIEQIKAALADDDYIQAWCTQNFGRIHKVFVDIDEKKPPVPENDYPIIVVIGLNQVRGDSVRDLSWELELGFGVVNKEIIEDGNIKAMTGFSQVQALRELAENALYRAGLGDVSTRAESGSVSYYPLFISGTVIPIKILKSNRRAMPV